MVFFHSLHSSDHIDRVHVPLCQLVWTPVSGAKRSRESRSVQGAWCQHLQRKTVWSPHSSGLHSSLHPDWICCVSWLDQGCRNTSQPMGRWRWGFPDKLPHWSEFSGISARILSNQNLLWYKPSQIILIILTPFMVDPGLHGSHFNVSWPYWIECNSLSKIFFFETNLIQNRCGQSI